MQNTTIPEMVEEGNGENKEAKSEASDDWDAHW
jgi:hypothetical protein